jgi:hypothetical protein
MFTMIDHIGRRISGTDAGFKFEVSSTWYHCGTSLCFGVWYHQARL